MAINHPNRHGRDDSVHPTYINHKIFKTYIIFAVVTGAGVDQYYSWIFVIRIAQIHDVFSRVLTKYIV